MFCIYSYLCVSTITLDDVHVLYHGMYIPYAHDEICEILLFSDTDIYPSDYFQFNLVENVDQHT